MNKLPDVYFDYQIGDLNEKITNLTETIVRASKSFSNIFSNIPGKQFSVTCNQEVFHLFDLNLDKANVNFYIYDSIRYYGRFKPLLLDIWFDGLMPFDKIVLSDGVEYLDIYISNLF